MSYRTDELYALVTNAIDGIVSDHMIDHDRPKPSIRSREIHEREAGIDDGTVYGTYEAVINGGQFTVELEASARYGGFEDCWSWASESHYTRDVEFEELEDFECKIIKFVESGIDPDLDKMVDADIESKREARND